MYFWYHQQQIQKWQRAYRCRNLQPIQFAQNTFGPLQPVSPAREAWRRGVLLADNLPLGQLITELNRYRPGHLGCDPAVAQLPVMGSFPLKDSDLALQSLLPTLPVQIEQHTPWWINVAARPVPDGSVSNN